jgi:hypothetical protein
LAAGRGRLGHFAQGGRQLLEFRAPGKELDQFQGAIRVAFPQLLGTQALAGFQVLETPEDGFSQSFVPLGGPRL